MEQIFSPSAIMGTSHFRLLIVDDNEAIHDDLRKILLPREIDSELAADEALLFGTPAMSGATFAVDSAFQVQEGLALRTTGASLRPAVCAGLR